MRRCLGAFVVLSVLLQAGRAQAKPSDPAAAQALFDEAKGLLAQGKLSDACPKFLASLKLDPKPGAAFNLADCYEKNGQTASAWARYLEAASLAQRAGQAQRAEVAGKYAAALEPTLSRLVIVASNAPSGLIITRDGVVIDAAVLGTTVPVDPGTHAIEARAPGKQPWSRIVKVKTGDANAWVVVPVLSDATEAPSVLAPVAPPSPPATSAEEGAPGWSGQKTAGLVLMGASSVGLVLGSLFAVQAHSKYSELAVACPTHMGCDPRLAPNLGSYHTVSTMSLVSFIGGGTLLGTGTVVYLTARKAGTQTGAFVTPQVGASYVGIEGGF